MQVLKQEHASNKWKSKEHDEEKKPNCHYLQMARSCATQQIEQKLLKLITKLRNVPGYKINTQNSPAFLYPYNEPTAKEIRGKGHSQHHPKKKKYEGINLTKGEKASTMKAAAL